MICQCGATLHIYLTDHVDEGILEIKISCEQCGVILHSLTGGIKKEG